MNIPSPVTGGKTRIVKTISTSDIIKSYKNIDVSIYFNGIKELYIMECLDTGYQFFYPFNVTGNSDYYDRMSEDERYYIPWKWEHVNALKYIKRGDKLLEIGCGNGDFLKRARETGANCYGIELNEKAIKNSYHKGLDVKNIRLENYPEGENNTFDVVCAFQVLEHLHDIKSFMLTATRLLKRGGILIIGVPNNDSFIKKDPFNLRNMPPHHMGLWGRKSLTNLSRHFNFSIKDIKNEPLQKYHFRYFYNLKIGNSLLKLGIMGKVINKVLYNVFAIPLLTIFSKKIQGHTIEVIFEKS